MQRKHWYIIIISVVIVATVAAIINRHLAQRAEREQALIFELKQLRIAVQLYLRMQKKWPADLATALDTKHAVHSPNWSMQRDASGKPVDPFGNPYVYDPKSGWLHSTTKGYGSW